MRVIFALATGLAVASSAAAQTVPDRYGPARSVVVAASTAPGPIYGQRMLGWSSKAVASAAQVEPPQAPRAEPPAAPSRAYSSTAPEPARPSQPLPASIYGPPAPTSAAPMRQATAPARAQVPAQNPVAPPPSAPLRMAATPSSVAAGGAPVRLYSLHREYGMTPDPTPPTPKGQHYVLVGPPDTAQPDSDTAEAAKADSRPDRPF